MEAAKAASAAGYTMPQYLALPGIPAYIDPDEPGESKSDVIARYRVNQLLEAIAQDMQAEQMKRSAKRKRR